MADRASQEDFIASIEDRSLRASIEAGLHPAWVATYGDASWEAAMAITGGPPPTDKALEPGGRSGSADMTVVDQRP